MHCGLLDEKIHGAPIEAFYLTYLGTPRGKLVALGSIQSLKGLVSIRTTAEALEFVHLQFCPGVRTEFGAEIRAGSAARAAGFGMYDGVQGLVYHKSLVKIVGTYPRVTRSGNSFALERLVVTKDAKPAKTLEIVTPAGSYRLARLKLITSGKLAKVSWYMPGIL